MPSTTPPVRSTRNDSERFATNEWFTHDDLQHPERYFEHATRIPELNRPEERRDTLDFFLAYREKLGRDLQDRAEDPEATRQILAAIARYDAAIARLRALIASAPETPAAR